MKNILVPTDFSKNAEVAMNYAMVLARQQNAKITLLNAFSLSYANAEVPFEVINEEIKETKKDSETQLAKLADKIKQAGDIRCESISVEDSPVEAILNAIKEKQIDFVIMGTKGATNLASAIFGSNAAKVIEKASCPVIAVPEEAGFTPIKKITFATAFHDNDIPALKELVKIAEPLRMQINILHVSDILQSREGEKKRMEDFKELVNREISYNNLSFQMLQEDSASQGLENYLKDESTGMIAMSTHRHSLFDRIFNSSLTKHMAYHSSIPLLVFHFSAKKAPKIF